MQENKYDNPVFFEKYSQMSRSREGLSGAGEWETLKDLLPDFAGKRVLDLGCGYGWHCIYAMEQGAMSVTGVDLSEKMLEVAREKTHFPQARYLRMPIEEINFAENSFDIVLSSLALHYVASFDAVAKRVNRCLVAGGSFVFSAEHPILPHTVRRTGITTRTARFCISLWTIIFTRVSVRRIFWGKRWSNITKH